MGACAEERRDIDTYIIYTHGEASLTFGAPRAEGASSPSSAYQIVAYTTRVCMVTHAAW